MTREEIKIEALRLAPSDRESLAEELLLSLPDTETNEIGRAWLAEAHRRLAEAPSTEECESADALIDRLKRKHA